MKKSIFSILMFAGLSAFCLTGCMDNNDDPDLSNFSITSQTSVGEVNTTIADIKKKYCAGRNGADYSRNASNFYTQVKESQVIEGVIVANDISGNLYQTLMLRSFSSDADTIGDCILLSIKNTCLYPYFQLGQKVKVNLKGLYVGCYSKTPKIGQPYYTSYGNLNLGPMLLDLCKTNIELVGAPDPNARELTPWVPGDAWLRATANRTYQNSPTFATVTGYITEVQGDNVSIPAVGEVTGEKEPIYMDADSVKYKIFAPEVLHDDGYGVDRTIQLLTNTSKVILRTSTENEIAFTRIPTTTCTFTGILTYYDGWQVQLRALDDLKVLPTEQEK
ncbi:MAG: hypothetical protein IJT97_04650 [Bacteroidaceae bacterium]|nr:hypothetical protein [Bacteroidaceae bacterium]